jgi:hypothetical protein
VLPSSVFGRQDYFGHPRRITFQVIKNPVLISFMRWRICKKPLQVLAKSQPPRTIIVEEGSFLLNPRFDEV